MTPQELTKCVLINVTACRMKMYSLKTYCRHIFCVHVFLLKISANDSNQLANQRTFSKNVICHVCRGAVFKLFVSTICIWRTTQCFSQGEIKRSNLCYLGIKHLWRRVLYSTVWRRLWRRRVYNEGGKVSFMLCLLS